MLVIGQIGLTQIQLPLESAPTFIFQRALTIELINAGSLGRDQGHVDFISERGWTLRIRMPGRVIKMLETIPQL